MWFAPTAKFSDMSDLKQWRSCEYADSVSWVLSKQTGFSEGPPYVLAALRVEELLTQGPVVFRANDKAGSSQSLAAPFGLIWALSSGGSLGLEGLTPVATSPPTRVSAGILVLRVPP